MGCLIRTIGFVLVLVALLIVARRLLEPDVAIPPLGSGMRDTIVDGVRWRSRESPGETHREPVIYVHGWLSSSSTFKRVLSKASAGRPAIAVDLPGAGFSDRPWPYDYTVGGQAEHLLRYLDARRIGRVVLVGNSLGGAICQVIAAAQPNRVVALVLADSAWPQMRVPIPFRILRTPVLGEIELELLSRPVFGLTLRHSQYARASRVTEEVVDDWWFPLRVAGSRRAALEAIRTNPRGAEGIAKRITAPTLVLWGREDKLLPSSEGLALSSAISNARFEVLPATGHLPQEETPEEFSRAVSEFLRGLR
ncbi:MAG TPA: alpha/beta hydrolase [Thermoanaerobaculia bacterium]|nr:alpha/beta hydrolase [Thermoanaerobaculia bacterium]